MAQRSTTAILLTLLLIAVLLAYSNHFGNAFHFDDSHTITDNPYIRHLRNIPMFFRDAQTFSTLPSNRAYRPVVSISLAIDYWLGGGLNPLFFHLSNFFWYLVQLVLMFFLFRTIFDRALPDPRNRSVAAFAVAWYGLHPANAETVNYIIQRGDLFSTLGVVAALLLYATSPAARKFGLYLIPVALGLLSKPTALIFPAILFAYVLLFEESARRGRIGAAAKRCLPALLVTIALLILQAQMTAATYVAGAYSAFGYRITQPFIALRYFAQFFLPLWLSADTDRQPFASFFDAEALLGFAFVILVLAAAVYLARRPQARPIAFGLLWFLLALVPTSVYPLAEVENDHRMFFPFVGLALCVAWTLALWLYRWRPVTSLAGRAVLAGLLVSVLAAYGWGTHVRNNVWCTEESLWLDVTKKSPHNGRGLMNYGLTQMSKGDSLRALEYFERATAYTPNYSILEINLGIANGALQRDAEAEKHFERALVLAPGDAQPHFFYGRWLYSRRRVVDALNQLRTAARINPPYLQPKYLLLEIYAGQRAWSALDEVANDVLRVVPGDSTALSYLNRSRASGSELTLAAQPARANPTPEAYLNLSLLYHQAGKYQECIASATEALKLKPDYAEAYNNIAAAYESMAMWDQAIQAAREALQIKPDFQLARNNLAWSEAQKKAALSRAPSR